MVTVTGFNYRESTKKFVQGNKSVISRYIKQGYYIISGGYGSYWMSKPSIAEIEFTIDDNPEKYTQNAKQLIRDYYGVQRVTRTKLEDFVVDCMLGAIVLKISNDGKLYF